MIAGSWQRPCLRSIPSRSAHSSRPSVGDSPSRLISNLPEYPRSFARRQAYCQWLNRHHIYRLPLRNDILGSPVVIRCQSMHYQSQQREKHHTQSDDSERSNIEAKFTKRTRKSRRDASHTQMQQTVVSFHASLSHDAIAKPSILNQQRHKLSWSQRKSIERRRLYAQKPPFVWRILKRRSSLEQTKPTPKPRPTHPRVRQLTSRGLSCWFRDTNQIYKFITSVNSRSNIGMPKYLLSFQRHVRNGAVYQAWSSKSWRGKAIWWKHALYYALLNSPIDALRIIADISRRGYLSVPDWVVADALLLIDARYVVDNVWQELNDERVLLFHETACVFLDQYTKRQGNASLPWCIVRRLSRTLDEPNLTRFAKSVVSSKTAWSIYTKLHAMYRYVELGNLNKALDLFATFTDEELANRAAQAFCYSVLRRKWRVKDLYALRRQLTIWFLKHGIQPDALVRHAILKNYLESGDKSAAFAMLKSIRAKGLAISEQTYAVFLNNFGPGDASAVSSLHSMAAEDGILRRSAFLSSYFIQIAASAGFSSGQNSFTALMALYEKMFDTTDLVSFGIFEQPKEAINLKHLSSSFALEWMILSWIHENKDSPDKLVSAYNNYQFHIRNNHPRIAMLASKAYIATAFVFAFGEHKLYLHMCTKVLQDMLQPEKPVPPPASESLAKQHRDDSNLPEHEKFLEFEEPAGNKAVPLPFSTPAYADWDIWESLKREPFSYKVAPPSTATWNALLTVVLRHQQYDAAENVLKAMQQAGHTADQMTWNILLRSFADRHGSIRDILAEMRGRSTLERRDDNQTPSDSSISAAPDEADTSFLEDESAYDPEYSLKTPSWQETDAQESNEWSPDTVHGEILSRV